jgi:hypothetical protein
MINVFAGTEGRFVSVEDVRCENRQRYRFLVLRSSQLSVTHFHRLHLQEQSLARDPYLLRWEVACESEMHDMARHRNTREPEAKTEKPRAN